jgi:hypothetical protein
VWLLFHHKEGTRVVAGGRSFVERCPTCLRSTRFDEVETTEQIGVFFVDISSDKQTGFRCRECRDVFDLRETDEPVETVEVPVERAADRAAALAEEQRRRDADKAARAIRIEDELAELKKRLGK